MRRSRRASANVLRVQGEMTIYRAAELAPACLGRLGEKPTTQVDLSEVTEIDTAGLQLLLMMNRIAVAAGAPLRIVNPSSCVRDVLALCNVTDLVATDGAAA